MPLVHGAVVAALSPPLLPWLMPPAPPDDPLLLLPPPPPPAALARYAHVPVVGWKRCMAVRPPPPPPPPLLLLLLDPAPPPPASRGPWLRGDGHPPPPFPTIRRRVSPDVTASEPLTYAPAPPAEPLSDPPPPPPPPHRCTFTEVTPAGTEKYAYPAVPVLLPPKA